MTDGLHLEHDPQVAVSFWPGQSAEEILAVAEQTLSTAASYIVFPGNDPNVPSVTREISSDASAPLFIANFMDVPGLADALPNIWRSPDELARHGIRRVVTGLTEAVVSDFALRQAGIDPIIDISKQSLPEQLPGNEDEIDYIARIALACASCGDHNRKPRIVLPTGSDPVPRALNASFMRQLGPNGRAYFVNRPAKPTISNVVTAAPTPEDLPELRAIVSPPKDIAPEDRISVMVAEAQRVSKKLPEIVKERVKQIKEAQPQLDKVQKRYAQEFMTPQQLRDSVTILQIPFRTRVETYAA